MLLGRAFASHEERGCSEDSVERVAELMAEVFQNLRVNLDARHLYLLFACFWNGLGH